MIRLFLSDIDGCLSEPYVPFDLDGMAALRALAARAEHDPAYPRLGVLTGRAYPYAEAVAQALGLTGPALFESGGGRFDLPAARIRYHPAFTPALERQLAEVRAWMMEQATHRAFSFDYGKRTQAGIVSTDTAAVEAFFDEAQAYVEARYPDLVVFSTPVSVDCLTRRLTKDNALRWVAEEEGVGLDEIAFVGDTRGDLAALRAAGLSFAPANAEAAVRAEVRHVTEGAALAGVLEAYRHCVRHNGGSVAEAA